MNRSILFIVALMLPGSLLAQIGKVQSVDQAISGTWVNSDYGYQMKLVFNKDGSCLVDGDAFNYSVTASTLTLSDGYDNTVYNYALSGGQLTLSGGDLMQAMTFRREGTPQTRVETVQTAGSANELIGTWRNQEETIVFTNRTMTINGLEYNYSSDGSQINIQTAEGPQPISYTLNGNQLSMVLNGITYSFQKSDANTPAANVSTQTASATNLPGTIDPSIVGKWYYYSSSSGYSGGGSSSERILEINADGTYRYYYEGSVSGKTHDMYGEEDMFAQSAIQDNDSGTWRLQGNMLHTQSNVHGYQTYTLQKQNNQNNEPMIIIDGDPYVTYYKRAPW